MSGNERPAMAIDEATEGPQCQTGQPLIMCPPRDLSNYIDLEKKYRKEIDDKLSDQETKSFRAVGLYSSNVTGKSTLAIHFAVRTLLDRSGTRFVFWVNCRDKISLKHSFTSIARELQFPDWDVQDHDGNRSLVLNWLQDTKFNWIIIYDDVASFDLITEYWPNEDCEGLAIITTSNAFLDSDIQVLQPINSDHFIEVGILDTHLYNIDRTIDDLLKVDYHRPPGITHPGYSEIEQGKILDLCREINGNLQEMMILGAILGRDLYTLDDMCDYFKLQRPRGEPRPIWSLAFRRLSPNSRALLSVLSFLHSDSDINLSLFKVESLPRDMAWCLDDAALEQSLDELVALSLISRRKQTHSISIPSATQVSFLRWIEVDGGDVSVQAGLERTTNLLHGIHQKQIYEDIEQLSLEDYFGFFQCLSHVRSLKDKFRAARLADPKVHGSSELCHLLTGFARYLLHEGFLSEVLEMVEAYWLAFGTLPNDQKSVDLSYPFYLQWRVHVHRGEKEKALECAIRSRDAWVSASSPGLLTTPRPDYLMALSYITTGDYHKALEWYLRCNDTWRINGYVSQGTTRESLPAPPIMKIQEAWARLLLKDVNSAKPLIESALEDIKSVHQSDPIDTATIEFVNFHAAKLRIIEKNFQDAKEKLITAQECLQQSRLRLYSQVHASYLYYLALCEKELGNLQQAMIHITYTARITRLYQDEMPMEHARCLLMIYEVSSRLPLPENESLSNEARLAANSLILKHSRAGGVNDVRSSRLEHGFSPTEFDEALAEKIYCLWR